MINVKLILHVDAFINTSYSMIEESVDEEVEENWSNHASHSGYF